MNKLVVLILIAVAAWLVWRALRRAEAARRRPRGPRNDGERMVDCSQCGLHLPVSEALESQGRYFCSEEHRRLFQS